METLKDLRNSYSNMILACILEGKFKILNSNGNGCLLLVDDCLELNMCFLRDYKEAVPVASAFGSNRELIRRFEKEEKEKMFYALENKMYETELRRLTSKRDSMNEEIDKLLKKIEQ